MKTIGLLGGMSWASTVSYYEAINRGVNAALGGLHSARVLLASVDFGPIEAAQHRGDWDATAKMLIEAARSVEAGGADFLLICTNTMHKVAPQIEAALSIPLLHIADATAEVLRADGVRCVGLLGTRFTMAQDFYSGRLRERFGLDVQVPAPEAQDLVHRVIYDELCHGVVSEASRAHYLEIIAELHERGAEAVILGGTEIALLVQAEHTTVPLYDTTAIHAAAAVKRALG
ncbi:aspartate/glutamate racemase family protein [Denitromonas sp.]|uniref:aspartate/glutamate racemase family protein n=1 Tax=Denitromonas sp. TaxID=2734609 RepID=UPI003A89916F